MSDPADDLKRLNAEMDGRLKNILEQAPPDLRSKLAQAINASSQVKTDAPSMRDAAVIAQQAVADLHAARAKADAAFADLQKINERRKFPIWFGVLVVVAFIGLLAWLAATHS